MRPPTTCPRCGGPGPFKPGRFPATWRHPNHHEPGFDGCGQTHREGEKQAGPLRAYDELRRTAFGDRAGD